MVFPHRASAGAEDCLPRLRRGDPRGNKVMAEGTPANPAAMGPMDEGKPGWVSLIARRLAGD